MRKRFAKKALAVALALSLCTGSVPVSALAVPDGANTLQPGTISGLTSAQDGIQEGEPEQLEEAVEPGVPEDAADPEGPGQSEEPAEPADPADAADPEPSSPAQPDLGDAATFNYSDGLAAGMLYGEKALNASLATSALSVEMSAAGSPGLQEGDTAADLVSGMFAQAQYGAGPEPHPDYPRTLDDSDIESITLKWVTPDSEDNGDDSLLYRVPQGDGRFSVVYQLDYALSGEHGYDPGDIQITVPATLFETRDGNPTGGLVIPLSESPGTRTDFNWARIGDVYVITNTKTMAAATKGFIQFEIDGLTPHTLVDMAETGALQAEIQVTTHRGNTIGLLSNKLAAQVNTTQQVTQATKRVNGSPSIVEASQVPESVRAAYPDEEYFVLVSWYMFAYHTGNQPYTLEITDEHKVDGYDGLITANAATA